MRTLVVSAAVAGLAVPTMAAPAAADPPVRFSEVVVFEGVNPCNAPDTHEITRAFTVALHEHPNDVVVQVESTVTTDDGFAGTGGETIVVIDTTEVATLDFDIASGEAIVDRFVVDCVRD